MEIIEDYVFDGRGANYPLYLIIHETANPGATALNHVAYWSTGTQGGEAQYVADWTGIVYHTTPDDRATWNVGGAANSWTVGIELCHATNSADFERVWETGVEFAAWYLNERGWGIDKMLSHKQANETWQTYSDHTDPDGYFEEYGKSWAQFVSDVKDRMENDMATPGEIWSFKNSGLEKVDAYQILRDARDYAKQAKAAAEKATAGNVDYDKLATAVADKLAARLKA